MQRVAPVQWEGPVPVRWITEVRRGHSTEEGGVQSGHTRSGEVRCRVEWRSSSSRITEDRRGHSTEEGGVQSGHTRSGEVKVQSKWRSSYSRIIEDRRGHSTEEGGVQPGHMRSEVILQTESDHRGQTRSQYRRGRCPVRSHEVRRGQSAERSSSSRITEVR